MKFQSDELVRKRISDALRVSVPDEARREEIAFHMTDWRNDLEDMVALYGEEEITDERVEEIINRFLIHVPNHVVAAQTLLGYGPITDVFEVGIFEED